MCENCSSQIFSLLTIRSNAAQAILCQPRPNSCTPLEVQAFCQHFPSIQHPAYSQIYLKKLTILSFPVLGNAKATLYPKNNSMLLNQKHLLKWGWLCRRNTYKDFCLQLYFHHCVSVVTHLLTAQRSFSVMLPLATSPIISPHSTIKHTASYKWPKHTSWTFRRYKCSKLRSRVLQRWVSGQNAAPGAGTETKTTADPDFWGSNTTTSTQLWDRYFSPTYQETISSRLDTDMTRQEKPHLSWPPSALGWVSWLPRARTLQQDLTESKMQFRGLWKMNKFELNQHMAFIRWRNGYELQSRLPRAHSYSLWSLEFHSHFGAQSVKTICQRRIHPRRHWEGNAIASAEELSYTKGEVWLNHNFSDSHQGFPKVESCTLWRGRYRPRATLYFHYLLHWDGSDKGRKKCEEKPRWAHQSVSWGVLWGRPSAGRRSYRRDIWTVSPQSATWCASAGSPSG